VFTPLLSAKSRAFTANDSDRMPLNTSGLSRYFSFVPEFSITAYAWV
jgi:hypothetical protein